MISNLLKFNFGEPSGVLEIASGITNPIALTALALIVLQIVMLAWMKSRRRKIPTIFWFVFVLVVVIGVTSIVYLPHPPEGIYHVRVIILDEQGNPVVGPLGNNSEGLEVYLNVNAAPQPWPGGWQFDVPTAIKPPDGNLILTAVKKSAFLKGEARITLKDNFNPPAVSLALKRDDSAKIRGQVVDGKNRAVAGARVFIVGYGTEAVITKEGGDFELPAHAAVEQKVKLYAEKLGYKSITQWHPAGDHPAVLVLER